MPPNFLNEWKIEAEWAAAIGTFLAVIVALFAARIERLWRGNPKLTIIAEQVVVLPPDEEGKSMIVFPIENNGRYLAENAEVFVKAVSREGNSGLYKQVSGFVPISLRWVHSESNHPEIFTTISPKLQRYCILDALNPVKKEPSLPHRDNIVYFELWTEYKRSTDANELSPGHYQIDLILAAAEMSPQPKKILLTVPPRFDPEEVKVIEKR